MTYQETMALLESLGTAQNRKVYASHGAGENQFGVSFANLYALQKKIKTDHALAVELWNSGNTDARMLATMIADPAKVDRDTARRWVKEARYYGLNDELVKNVIVRTPYFRDLMNEWLDSPDEYEARAGWTMLNHIALNDPSPDDTYFEKFLPLIEQEIHNSPNRKKEMMNYTLIAIGIRNPVLKEKAVESSKRIGKVKVDHGETWCKTPDAIPYIEKVIKRKGW
ncbi:MAG: hypothetical protein A2Y33_05640 [Spirochaetes bacterium GWF1_51_8]|nr:MAG: hypothetical protein A2Y33_05640 [Spirochaetes bacterium GWF1_51_8]